MNWNEPYARRLKRYINIGSLLLILGGLALAVAGTLVPRSLLPDTARIFYTALVMGGIGAGAGLVGASLWLAGHPERAKAAYVADRDEREQAIWTRSGKWAFWALYYSAILAMVVAAPLNITVFFTLLAVFGMANILFLASLLLTRKML